VKYLIKAFVLMALVSVNPEYGLAQTNIFAYPMANQSQQQQAQDRFQCHQWSVQQTGFDPTRQTSTPQFSNVAQAPMPSAPQGGMFRDAARGAAIGAAAGSLAGNAGRGAAIGTLTTTLFGGIRRRNRRQQQQAWQQQQQQQQRQYQQQQQFAHQQQSHNYRAAFGACMSARNYKVQ